MSPPMDTNERKSVRADLRFLCYLLFKNAKVQSIEQKETEKTEIARYICANLCSSVAKKWTGSNLATDFSKEFEQVETEISAC